MSLSYVDYSSSISCSDKSILEVENYKYVFLNKRIKEKLRVEANIYKINIVSNTYLITCNRIYSNNILYL